MTWLLVPHDVTQTTATVWIGAVNDDVAGAHVELDWGAGRRSVAAGWQREAPAQGRYELAWQRVAIDGLEARREHPLRLFVDGTERATGRVTTLPDRLPTELDARPFSVMLGSCFANTQDASGRAGRTYALLPAAARPDLKFLSGDQVYLDVPTLDFMLHTHDGEALLARLLGTYVETWGQGNGIEGFSALLRDGACFFTADDHELWNNAPQAGALVRDTWSADGRRRWLEIAKRLFGTFQSPERTWQFDVPPLSFLVMDTRLDRAEDRTRLVSVEARQRLEAWLAALAGPGVLVVGQPLFWPRAGRLGFLFDYGLPDFAEYGDLIRLLGASRHSIVVLTGDVHFGRVARCALAGGGELIEVIASPLSLVHKGAAGGFKRAPRSFPAEPLPGIVPASVETHAYEMTGNHFLTAAFASRGSAVTMRLKAWRVQPAGGLPSAQLAYERRLH